MVKDHRATVKNQFVLPAHLVDISNGAMVVFCAIANHGRALANLAAVVRRAIDVDIDCRASLRLLSHWPTGIPDVFANSHTYVHSTNLVQRK